MEELLAEQEEERRIYESGGGNAENSPFKNYNRENTVMLDPTKLTKSDIEKLISNNSERITFID